MEEMAWENGQYVMQGYIHERGLWSTHNTLTVIFHSSDGLTVHQATPYVPSWT